jgi:catechol 2,3-dioxygenase-like lactoylglutathione lyase family enzyme
MSPAVTIQQHLHGIRGFRLVTADLPRLVAFYRDVLGFTAVGDVQPIPSEELRLLGLRGGGERQLLSIGLQTVAVDHFEMTGRPYPADSDAASLWFQHLALVVVDIAKAHERLRNVYPISIDGPRRLPASSGGVEAFKFRDPDGHPLELLRFPSSDVPATWVGRTTLPGQIALGIDHSAISVNDADTSKRFYSALGLKPDPRAVNVGPAQQRLDDLRNVEVSVIPLIPDEVSPHLELLAYHVPQGDKAAPARANDTSATRVLWRGTRAELLRDPDGHLQQIEP